MRRSTERLRRRTSKPLPLASATLLALGLAGCEAGTGPAGSPLAEQPPSSTSTPVRIGVLLPLSGPEAPLGQSLLNAIRLAAGHGTAPLDVQDTAGTLPGATAAATRALQAQDGVILGPLTAQETRAASAVATPAGVPILSLTSDITVAKPGVWVLGLTPAQQVERLVEAAHADGRSRFAAFLPDNALGDAMAAALGETVSGADIARHDQGFASINDGLKALSAFDSRHANDAQIKADRASSDPAMRAQADALAAEPVPTLPFDALVLADTGTQLQEVIDLLQPYDITPGQVRIMGPALWGAFAQKLGQIAGAWYAAPDPASRAGFVAAFNAQYHVPPLRIDDFAFDAGALASALATQGGFSTAALTRPDGFAGTDGIFTLQANGRVERGLAVFQIDQGGGSHIVSPAPARLVAGGA